MSLKGDGGQRRIRSISVLIPTFNEADHIEMMLDDLSTDPWIKKWGDDIEVIVIDDGSSDDTSARARNKVDKFATLRVLSLAKNMGKGQVLATGINEAKGQAVVFLDGDHTFDFEALPRFADAIEKGADVVVGDRRNPKSIFFVPSHVIPYIHFRHFVGQRFNTLVRLMTELEIADTQCGFKMFTKEAAQHGFSRIRVGGFIFDVEVLLAVKKAGFRIEALPVRLRYNSPEPIWETLNMSARVSRSLIRVLHARIKGEYSTVESTDPADDQGPKLTGQRKR